MLFVSIVSKCCTEGCNESKEEVCPSEAWMIFGQTVWKHWMQVILEVVQWSYSSSGYILKYAHVLPLICHTSSLIIAHFPCSTALIVLSKSAVVLWLPYHSKYNLIHLSFSFCRTKLLSPIPRQLSLFLNLQGSDLLWLLSKVIV